MAKRTRTDKKPIHVVAPLDDVLERFAGLAPTGGHDAAEMPAVTLIEDEGTGDRLLVYVGPNGTDLEIQTVGDEPWFTQKQLAQMFGVDVRTVNHHVQEFSTTGELDESTIRNFRIVRDEGGRQVAREVLHYGLDAAFYVGYRVNSAQGVLFRKWATQVLVAFATKGFVIHKRRLKHPENFDRIRELRDTINEIRASDVPLYAELRRICSLCQDFDPKSQAARDFFAHMRAKLYWAVTSNTPSMLLRDRADATQTNMGMLSWKKDAPRQDDATSPQSYLAEVEGRELSNLTVILLDVPADADVGSIGAGRPPIGSIESAHSDAWRSCFERRRRGAC